MRFIRILRFTQSNLRSETIESIGKKVQPYLPEPYKNSFYGSYGRATAKLKALYEPTLDKINKDFEENWSNMSEEKMGRYPRALCRFRRTDLEVYRYL